jgi:hypothetical protein
VNTDGDATKNRSYIAGYWNNSIQRLFVNTNSMLYGARTNSAYSSANMAILNASENMSFADYSESSAENGPFKKLSVCTPVTNDSLTLGFKFSGKATGLGF